MINENILGRRFRFRRSCGGHRISPLASQYQCPRQSLLISTSRLVYTTDQALNQHSTSSSDMPCKTKSVRQDCSQGTRPLTTALSTLIYSRWQLNPRGRWTMGRTWAHDSRTRRDTHTRDKPARGTRVMRQWSTEPNLNTPLDHGPGYAPERGGFLRTGACERPSRGERPQHARRAYDTGAALQTLAVWNTPTRAGPLALTLQRPPYLRSILTFNCEPFNRSNFNICCWSWNYRGCWHQTCPSVDSQQVV